MKDIWPGWTWLSFPCGVLAWFAAGPLALHFHYEARCIAAFLAYGFAVVELKLAVLRMRQLGRGA